ncbi:MAG: hypothetical protein GXO21_06515 [Aquificae bacterium]|nr:hypothetical protein [Aquificota bacterium]
MKKKLLFFSLATVFISSCGDGGGNGSPFNDKPIRITPSTDLVKFKTTHFSGSGNCAQCHSNLVDKQGEDVSIDTDWRSTMMANSSKDPFWQAKTEVEILRNKPAKEVIEIKCATCHMPMAEKQAEFDNDTIAIFGDGFLNPDNKYHLLAMDGVSCTVCHQIQDDGKLGTKESFSGNYTIDKDTPRPYRPIYGHFPNPFQNPMINSVEYIPVYSAHMTKSELCATCHTLYTPTLDDNGNIIGEIPEQTAYLEWKHSIFGDGTADDLSCQDCHMPLANGGVVISTRPRRHLPEREPFYKHYFVGGNIFMLKILRNNIETLALTATEEHFDQTIIRTKDILKSSASIEIGNIAKQENVLEIPVTVINKSGHKLPTGYPSRRVWIHFIVKDKNGNVVFESGKSLRDGRIIGCDADEGNNYEPHYQIIDSEDKVQIYESVMADIENKVTYTLLRGAKYIKDNRLLPEGFDKKTATEDIKPQGNAFSDNDFVGGKDTLIYKIDITGHEGPYTIEAYLKFQSLSYAFYKDLLKDENNSEYVRKFKSMYEKEDNSGEIIAEVKKTF